MKALRIDSKTEKVELVELSADSNARMDEMHGHIGCSWFTVGWTFRNGDVLYVDDEGLLTIQADTKFFQLERTEFLAGNGLIVGPEISLSDSDDDYTMQDVQHTPEEVKPTFLTLDEVRLAAGV